MVTHYRPLRVLAVLETSSKNTKRSLRSGGCFFYADFEYFVVIIPTMSAPLDKSRIGFGDLDNFLKIAPIIGLAILAYLQTLFPSKIEFDKLEEHLIQMDKKITEISVLQQSTSNNSIKISNIDERVRQVEIDLVRTLVEKK
jgi:hypothetical protein